jgi:hypothetical protein
LSPGSSDGPRVTAQDLNTPSTLQAKVIVQARRVVLLDDEARIFGGLDATFAARLGSLREIAARLIL